MKQQKEKSLFFKIVTIWYEQAKRRKALRLLAKQQWSVEFLTALLVKAAKLTDSPLVLEIQNKQGMVLKVRSDTAHVRSSLDDDDSIFNHLDDDAAIQAFIERNARR